MRHPFLVVSILASLAACSPDVRQNAGDGGTDTCTGTETRCSGLTYQTCQNGTFQSTTTCTTACAPTLGCVQCDPGAGNACNANDVVTCNSDGTYGNTVTACTGGMSCKNGSCSSACTADGVDLVYVVSDANDFFSFDPRKLPSTAAFTPIGNGKLSCSPQLPPADPTATGPAQPFSMSVDRMGVAWVLYNSGEIFKVSITTGACTPSGYVAKQNNMILFGMGFVTDTSGGNSEKLYLGGGAVSPNPGGKLASVDTTAMPLKPTILGSITASSEYSPELTGTSEGKLYGFYPGLTRSFVQEIAKSGATAGMPVGPEYALTGGLGNTVQDWAFAQWGGKFYIFVTTVDALGQNPNSTVRVIDKATGAYSTVLSNLPCNIDGAGVSTCAPVVIGRTAP
jgi:hypothetical protein